MAKGIVDLVYLNKLDLNLAFNNIEDNGVICVTSALGKRERMINLSLNFKDCTI